MIVFSTLTHFRLFYEAFVLLRDISFLDKKTAHLGFTGSFLCEADGGIANSSFRLNLQSENNILLSNNVNCTYTVTNNM